MAYTKIINKAYDLADELKKTPVYLEMKRLNELIKTKYKKELNDYQKVFSRFDEILNTGGVYHPDFKEVNSLYSEVKTILYSKEEVKEYFKNEQKMNEILKEIADEISLSVSNYKDFKGGFCKWK